MVAKTRMILLVFYLVLSIYAFPTVSTLKAHADCSRYNESLDLNGTRSVEDSIIFTYRRIQQTATRPGAASYLGCFSPLHVCTIKRGKFTEAAGGADTDVVKCIKECWEKRKRLALLKDSTDCLCSDLLHGLVSTGSSHCKTPCAGNTSQACGGIERLSVYYTGYIEEPRFSQVSREGIQKAFKGCYEDFTYSSLCPFSIKTSRLNVAMCMSFCENNVFHYAALAIIWSIHFYSDQTIERSTRCCCSNSLEDVDRTERGLCQSRCPTGRSNEPCGGELGYLAVYATDVSEEIEDISPKVPDYFWMHPNIDDKIVQRV